MSRYPHTWMIAGGWAIDLFLNRETREHSDLEIAIPRNQQQLLYAYLKDWKLQYVISGQLTDWPEGLVLQLPIHEIHGFSAENRIEVLLNEIEGDAWRFRRDQSITYPADKVWVRSKSGIPILCPEIVLLYKAKNFREKDQADLLSAVAHLGLSTLQWLRASIVQAHGSDHSWTDLITEHISRVQS